MTEGTFRRVSVTRELLDAILAHARADAPRECCGLLLGTRTRLDVAVPARNMLASPTRFRIDPRDHFAALRSARSRGIDVVGAYHSHPASPAVPSPRDLAEAADPALLHLIASVRDHEVRAYSLQERNFRPVELVVFS